MPDRTESRLPAVSPELSAAGLVAFRLLRLCGVVNRVDAQRVLLGWVKPPKALSADDVTAILQTYPNATSAEPW